jgi:hypothetical protein
MTLTMEVQNLSIDRIRTDGDTQARAGHDSDTIREYAELMEAGRTFPPLVVFDDGDQIWLADGFHRLLAAKNAGRTDVACEVRKGTLDEAKWFACGANADHGLRRSHDDKRQAIRRALLHPNSHQLSDRQIAEHVGVDPKTVGRERAAMISTEEILSCSQRYGKDGKLRSLPRSHDKESGWWTVGGEQNPTRLMNQIFAAVKQHPDVQQLLNLLIEEFGLVDDPHEQLSKLARILALVELDRLPESPFEFNFAEYWRLKENVAETPADPGAIDDQKIWEKWLYEDYRREFYFTANRWPGITNALFWRPIDDAVKRSRSYIQEHGRMPPSIEEFRPTLDFSEAANWYPPFIRENCGKAQE